MYGRTVYGLAVYRGIVVIDARENFGSQQFFPVGFYVRCFRRCLPSRKRNSNVIMELGQGREACRHHKTGPRPPRRVSVFMSYPSLDFFTLSGVSVFPAVFATLVTPAARAAQSLIWRVASVAAEMKTARRASKASVAAAVLPELAAIRTSTAAAASASQGLALSAPARSAPMARISCRSRARTARSTVARQTPPSSWTDSANARKAIRDALNSQMAGL